MQHLCGSSRPWSAGILTGLLLVGVGSSMVGCGKSALPTSPRSGAPSFGVASAARDSVPKPPGRPPRPPVLTAQFVGADPTPADSTGDSRWLVGNMSPHSAAVHWTVTGDSSWSALPIEGTLLVGRRSNATLDVPIPVPAGTTPGSYPLLLTVQSDAVAASAAGSITVPGDSLRIR